MHTPRDCSTLCGEVHARCAVPGAGEAPVVTSHVLCVNGCVSTCFKGHSTYVQKLQFATTYFTSPAWCPGCALMAIRAAEARVCSKPMQAHRRCACEPSSQPACEPHSMHMHMRIPQHTSPTGAPLVGPPSVGLTRHRALCAGSGLLPQPSQSNSRRPSQAGAPLKPASWT